MTDGAAAIVGMACVFPGAADLDAYWRNLAGGVDAVGPLPPERWPGARGPALPEDHEAAIPLGRGGFVPTPRLFDAARHGVMPRVARDGDPDQFLLLDVVAAALADAGIAADDARRADTDLVVGRGGYTSNTMMEVFLRAEGIDRFLDFLSSQGAALGLAVDGGAWRAPLDRALRDALTPYDIDALSSSIPNLVPSRAANRLDLGGAAYTVDGACASSLLAVEDALLRLRAGRCALAVAAGVNFAHVPAFWWLFTRILATSPSGQIRPFDRRADGLLIGEGAGAVVLKRLDDAIADGDRVWAVIRGAGSASDGRDKGILAPSSRGQVRALERAYADARVDPDDVTFLEAHGTGTPAGDAVELETVRAFFGPPRGPHGWRVLGAVKSMLGHLMPAAGMAALIKTALALSNKVLPPSLHCEQPRALLGETAFWLSPEARPWLHPPDRPRRAGVNAFGFGGIDAHLVLEEAVPGPRSAALRVRPLDTGVARPSELLLFSGEGRAALGASVARAARFLEADVEATALEDVARALGGEADPAAPWRLALVAGDDAAQTAGRLRELAGALDAAADEEALARTLASAPGETLFLARGAAPAGGKVAAVFPGIGFPGLVGAFPRHLVENALHFPAAREVFDRVERREPQGRDPLPTSFLLSPPPHLPEDERARLRGRFAPPSSRDAAHPAPDARNLSHLGMLAGNEASWRILRGLAVPVDMLCGQSLGDVSAVLAAGMADFEENVERFWPMLDLDLQHAGTGILAMVGASEAALAPHLERFPAVGIALHLSPEAQLVGGPEADVRALAARLREEQVLVQPLPFPPIHTQALSEVEDVFRARADGGSLRPPRIPIWSSALAAPMPDDPAGVEAVLHANIAKPIRFWQTLRAMADAGARVLVQIGSGTLAANGRTVLDRDDVLCEAMDTGHRHPLTQLQALAGRFFERGVPFAPEGLFSGRPARDADLDRPRRPAPAPPTAVPLALYRPPFAGPAGVEAPASAGPRPAAAPHPDAGKPAGPLPFVGRAVEHVPGERLVADVRLALEEHRYLEDHVFARGGDAKPLSHRLPVVPMTMTLELLAEHAAYLAPGLGLVAVEDLRALRWIAFEEIQAVDLRVDARVEGREDDIVRVRAALSRAGATVARADLLFASRYRRTIDLAFEAAAERPLPFTAGELYEAGVLFHGPRFRALASIDRRAGRRIEGRLEVLAQDDLFASTSTPQLLTDPVVLDAAGQLLGSMYADADGYLLPVGVDRIEFYRPRPAVGTLVPARIAFRDPDVAAHRAVADLEVQDGEGRVWFRIRGWRDKVLRWSRQVRAAWGRPDAHLFAHRIDLPGLGGGDVAVRLDAATLRDLPADWLARIVLDEEEWAHWRSLDALPPRRRAWLLGRVAVKDAARAWLAEARGAALAHPAAVGLAREGAPRPHRPDAPHVSLAHAGETILAVASAEAVGIDVEPWDAAKDLGAETFTAPAERRLLADARRGVEPVEALTRLWCAKEAAAKAWGRGLEGRPRALEVREIGADGRALVVGPVPGRAAVVAIHRTGDLVVAVARQVAEREEARS